MTEHAPARLMELLERRAETLVEGLDGARRRAETSRAQAERLAQHNRALSAELTALRAADAERRARLAELEQQLAALQAQRLELAEENRELDEQNRELEGYSRHLQERLAGSAAAAPPRRARTSKGLSALMGHCPDPQPAAPAPAPAPVQEPAPKPAPEPAQKKQQQGAADPAPSPQALLQQWYARYPGAFFKGHTRPLKVGIHEDLAALEPWPEKLVRRALACYVNLPRYLKAVRDGAERIDLDGRPAGRVDAGAADHARRKLERLQAARAERRGKEERANKKAGGKKASAKNAAGEQDAGKQARSGRRGERRAAPPHSTPALPDGASRPAEREDPAERMRRKLDALMARHAGPSEGR